MIIIFSNSYDLATVGPVYEDLKLKGNDTLLYLSDHVASGQVRQSLTLDKSGELLFTYGDRVFSPKDVKAAWCRRPNVFNKDEPKEVNTIFLNNQRKECQNSLLYSIPDSGWLNSPSHMQSIHNDKIRQLQIAHQFGLAIPKTVIGNDWKDTYDSFNKEEVVMKVPKGLLYFNDQPHFLPTTIVDSKRRAQLKDTSPFPGIWQEFIPKAKEWRVTVVGMKVFAVAIYTTNEARNDWRKHQFKRDAVTFKTEKLPQDIEEKCLAMLQSMNLKYGAFDFIEGTNGIFTFLEVNLNGQYQWLVDELELPIAKAVSDELIKISHN